MKHYHSLAQLCFQPRISLFMLWPLTSAAILNMQQHICCYGLYEVLWLLWMLIVYYILHPFLFTDKPCKAWLVMNVSISNCVCNSFRKLLNKRLLEFNCIKFFALNFYTINDKVILCYEKRLVAHYDLPCLLRVFD